jgi:hypothetical protein
MDTSMNRFPNRSMNRRWILVALIALPAGGCSELLSEPFEYGEVQVTTVLDSGEPLGGVHLVLYSGTRVHQQASTDDNGYSRFRFVPPGALGVSVEPPLGFRLPGASYTTFTMNEGDRREVTFTFEACLGSIAVLVVDDEGEPVPDAGLLLYAPRGELEDVRTDAAGRYDFVDILCGGGYAVKVTPPPGYSVEEGPGSSYNDGLTVGEGAPVELVFTLAVEGD